MRGCATLRQNGTAPASGYPRAGALLRRCATPSKVRTCFEKCASGKIPMIPSKMRTLFEGAHAKLRTFELIQNRQSKIQNSVRIPVRWRRAHGRNRIGN